jgi:hypothetical protein
MSKKTVGQASYDLQQKTPERINAIDMQREMQKSVLKELEDIIAKHRHYAPSYYIVYLLRKERLIPNAIRQQFVVRQTRPKPDYDSSLFSYDNDSSTLKYHWTVPDEQTCQYLLLNKDHLRDDEKELFSYVKRFAENTLV